ncbi:hypothetical protein LY474_06915 [Myxococcus stipitatus]|uniref:hypothetical protein n=1 Tax=Myxococcus stipitatus TaxID=83455 RepID=UPI001F252B90|nr:hypothetical protein [Myxococcus stipitatus]MCE9667543.1 hypothetical protein [Myxococcus stipitatus]
MDIEKLWALNQTKPHPEVAAAPSGLTPVLLAHTVTAFPNDGFLPGNVFALGYEFVLHDQSRAATIAVAPSDEVLRIASIHQKVSFGVDLGGKWHYPTASGGGGGEVLESLGGATISCSTDQRYAFDVTLDASLRKVVGAPVGVGGALWKLYRQNESLDRPFTLLQTLLLPKETVELRCTVKTWVMRAGFLGTRWGAVYWPYADQDFAVMLR